MPLRRRLVLAISLILAGCVTADAALTYWQALRKIDVEMSSAATVGESTLREEAAQIPAASDRRAQIETLIRSFDGDRHLEARYYGAAGQAELTSIPKPAANPAPRWLRQLLDRPRHSFSLDLPPPAGGGRLAVEANPANEMAEVWDEAKLKLLSIGAFSSLVLAFVYATLGHALRPLENLSAALERVGHGDFGASVVETGPEDLAVIYRQFNQMSKKLAEAEDNNLRLIEQLANAQDEERTEIARDLHDDVGPFLFAASVDAQAISAFLERGAVGEAAERTSAVRQSINHIQTHIRSILGRLRPPTLVDLGLTAAADQLISFWQDRFASIRFETAISAKRYPAPIEEAAFRILQEGLSNAVRHGKPGTIHVSIGEQRPGTLRIAITDNGLGFKDTIRSGFGITGMRERLSRMSGTLSITSSDSHAGVTLIADIPLGIPDEPLRAEVPLGLGA